MTFLQDFILKHKNWKELLSNKPYCLKIVESEKYVLFFYDQIESDFKENIVCEARGIILKKPDFKTVCRAFDKFFNYRESLAPIMEFDYAKVQEKIDGFIMKLWFDDDEWHLSSNGTIDAYKTTCPTGETLSSLFLEGFSCYGNFKEFTENLDKSNTYIFEVVHPLMRVVIPYKEPKVFHIGTRNNTTSEELILDIGISKPKNYRFDCFDDVVKMAKELPYSQEGYVVVDYNPRCVRRVKIKSPSYLAAHHMKNNGVITYERIAELVIKNEQEEFLSVFYEYKEKFDEVIKKYDELVNIVEKQIESVMNKSFEYKKEFALAVKDFKCRDFFFSVVENKYTWYEFKKFLKDKGGKKVAEILGFK